jgi:hypothetical protein
MTYLEGTQISSSSDRYFNSWAVKAVVPACEAIASTGITVHKQVPKAGRSRVHAAGTPACITDHGTSPTHGVRDLPRRARSPAIRVVG